MTEHGPTKTAHHEAGHALAVVRYGFPLTGASVVPEDGAGGRTAGRITFDRPALAPWADADSAEPPDVETLARLAVVALAGPATAPRRALPPPGGSQDMTDVWEYARLATGDDPARAAEAGRFVADAWERACRLVDAHAPALRDIARALDCGEELDGPAATATVERALASQRSWAGGAALLAQWETPKEAEDAGQTVREDGSAG
jgi:hypothetical protein